MTEMWDPDTKVGVRSYKLPESQGGGNCLIGWLPDGRGEMGWSLEFDGLEEEEFASGWLGYAEDTQGPIRWKSIKDTRNAKAREKRRAKGT